MAEDKYFEDYGPIQAHKHALLKRYLGAWYPKLSSWNGRVLYMETHAGRGVHESGDLGSPLIALDSLLGHSLKDRILNRSEIHFYLMELKPEYVATLKEVVSTRSTHPNIRIHVDHCDFAAKLRSEIDRMKGTGMRMVPAFVFVDPFGYQIPLDLVKGILAFPSCEIMMNFMAQPVARAVRDATKAGLLNTLYGSDEWRRAEGISDFEAQKAELTRLYEQVVGAKWTTKLRLTDRTDYTLLHFTNNDEGRREMKKSVWAVTEKFGKGGAGHLLFRDNPEQGLLIELEPDLTSLREAFKDRFRGMSFKYADAAQWLLSQDFLDKHLHAVLNEGRKSGWLETDYKKPFGPAIGQTPMRVGGLL